MKKAKAIRKYLRDSGVKNPQSIRLQLQDRNVKLVNNGVIDWDEIDATNKIIKSRNIASAGYHEFTVVNGKVFDNISPNGIDLEEFTKRLIPEAGTTFSSPIINLN